MKWLRYIGILSGVLEHRRVECCSIDGESGVELEKPFSQRMGLKGQCLRVMEKRLWVLMVLH